jgi:hypothetical protein
MSRYENEFQNPIIKIKVVGVIDSFRGDEFVTLQSLASKMIA